MNNIYKSIAFFKKHCKCLSPCSIKCTFPNALECLNDKKQELKNYFNDKKEKQNERIKFYFINEYGKINAKMFRELKPDKHRKKITFMDIEKKVLSNVESPYFFLFQSIKDMRTIEILLFMLSLIRKFLPLPPAFKER